MTQEQQTHKCQTCGSFLLGCTLAEHQAGYCPRILLSGKPTPPATPLSDDDVLDVASRHFSDMGWHFDREYQRQRIGALRDEMRMPATPQPETLLIDVPHAEVDALVEAIYTERRAFSPPPDVERLTTERNQLADRVERLESQLKMFADEARMLSVRLSNAAMTPERIRRLLSSTPGEPR